MSWVLSLEEHGSAAAAGRLDHLASAAGNPEGFFRKVGDLLMAQSRKRWNTEPGWAPLEWSTVQRKARSKDPRTRANAHQTLRATGALERALTVWGAPGQKYEVSPEELAFGIYVGGAKRGGSRVADVWYGVMAQKGIGEPRRRILAATAATRRRVHKALLEHLGLEG